LLAILNSLKIEAAADDVIAYARQIRHPASPYKHYGVLL
jgi:hypothetical protein